jgi:hypothetical protein
MNSKFKKSNKNRNSRENGSRSFIPQESKRKVVSHDGLLLLSVDGNNVIQWLDAMHRYLQREYGVIGQLIETNVLHERTLPTLKEI